jgi:hypothetical protein
MTDATSTTPATTTTAAAPTIDVAAIAQQAAAAAAAEAGKIMEQKAKDVAAATRAEIARSISGEKEPSQQNQVLERFVQDPVKFAQTIKDVAKREMREEAAAERQLADVQRSVLQPLVSEYPELNSEVKLDLVEKRTERYERSGISYPEALKKAAEETVKEFGLKSVSEAQRESGYRAAGLPGGGGFSPGAPTFDPAKSEKDFFSGMKERMNAQRKRA